MSIHVGYIKASPLSVDTEEDLIEVTKVMKDKMILEAVQEAKIKADAELKNALELIDAEKAKAVKEIKTVVVDLSIQAASKLIDKNLDNADNKKFINETIDEIGQAK